ncbi:hypothetical protein ACHAWF_008013 [Thalassiosira exigua]
MATPYADLDVDHARPPQDQASDDPGPNASASAATGAGLCAALASDDGDDGGGGGGPAPPPTTGGPDPSEPGPRFRTGAAPPPSGGGPAGTRAGAGRGGASERDRDGGGAHRRRIVRARRPPGDPGATAANAEGAGGGAGGTPADSSGAVGFFGRVDQVDDGPAAGRHRLHRHPAWARDEADDDDGDDAPLPREIREFLRNVGAAGVARSRRRPDAGLCKDIRPDDDDDEDEDEDGEGSECGEGGKDGGEGWEGNAERCAACFRAEDRNRKWRRLVTLPCCGANGREAQSSTRFCAACILRLAVARSDAGEYGPSDDEPDEYPVRKFYQKALQTDERRLCECPRCRDVLLVKIRGVKPVRPPGEGTDADEDSSECECSDCDAERKDRRGAKTAKSISVQVPTFKAKCWYVGRKKGVARLLWRVSKLHHEFLPYEALGGEDEEGIILRLVGWGLIEKKASGGGGVYRIGRDNHAKLIRFFRIKDPTDADRKRELDLGCDLGPYMLWAAWRHLRDEGRVDRSLRMLNRFNFLILHFYGWLPPLPLSRGQELVVTTLIMYAVTLVAQFLCIVVLYAVAFFGVGISVCYVLRRSNKEKKLFWWQVFLTSYFAYRLHIFFYQNPYLRWDTMVAPKAWVVMKTFLQGH